RRGRVPSLCPLGQSLRRWPRRIAHCGGARRQTLRRVRAHGAGACGMIGRRRAALCLAVLLLALGLGERARADAVSDALKQIAGDSMISREVVLGDLGFSQPMVMAGFDSRQEVYLPVPAGIPLSDAYLQLDGRYLRTDGGRTTVLLSLD